MKPTRINPYLSIANPQGLHGNRGRKYKTKSVKKMMFAMLHCLEFFAQKTWLLTVPKLKSDGRFSKKRRIIYLYKHHPEDVTPIQEPQITISYRRYDCRCGQIFYGEQIPNHICLPSKLKVA